MQNTADIVLIEDNDDHAFLTIEILNHNKVFNNVVHFRDGTRCIDYLRGLSSQPEDLLPALIILDINLPGVSGFDLLQFMKQSDYLKDIPVVILTSSSSKKDMQKSLEYRASAFLEKPLDSEQLQHVLEVL